MFDKIPASIKLTALTVALMAGPLVAFSFILGGAVGGAAAVVGICFFLVILYMVAVRKYL